MTPAGSRSLRRVLPWLLVAAFVVATSTAVYLGATNPQRGEPLKFVDALWAFSFIGFSLTGAIILQKMPERAIGWLFCLVPLLLVSAVATGEYARTPGVGVTGADWIAWAANILFGLSLAALIAFPYLLPDGKPASKGWRNVMRAGLAAQLGAVFATAFGRAVAYDVPSGVNPAQIGPVADVLFSIRRVLEPAAILFLILGCASIFGRLRRADGTERLQLRWVAFGAIGVIVSFLITIGMEAWLGPDSYFVGTLLTIGTITAFPATLGIAILKYRLYNVDLVINRAVVYSLLTGLLVAMHLALVTFLQAVLPVAADNQLGVAASTLAVAAAFNPIRRRLQAAIDHLFFRGKYDAQRTVTQFQAHLRDEVDLESLDAALIQVVEETMQPVHISLWIRDRAGAT